MSVDGQRLYLAGHDDSFFLIRTSLARFVSPLNLRDSELSWMGNPYGP